MDAGTTAIAGAVAVAAALASEEHEVVVVLDAELRRLLLAAEGVLELGELVRVRLVLLLAVGADSLHQALGQDGQQRVGEVERIETHVEQADDCLDGAVRMERAEHEVTGQRRLDARLGCFLVAHLTDHDDVGVGAQEGAHRLREREADLGLHLHLPQPILRDFDGVLGRPDLALGLVDVAQERVQRRRLARAGGPHAQDQAVGLFGRRLDLAQVAVEHAELVDRDRFAGGEDAHDDILVAALRGHGRHAQLDVASVRQLELDLAVLRLAALGDVERGHDLDAGHERATEAARHALILVARAVDAQPDHRVLLRSVRLDVDVGRARLVGVHDQLVGQADDRAVVLVDLAAANVLILLGLRLVAEIRENLAHAGPRAGAFAAGDGEELLDVLPESDGQLDLVIAHHLVDRVHTLDVLRIVDQHERRAVALAPQR